VFGHVKEGLLWNAFKQYWMGDEKQLSFYTLRPAHTQLHANGGHQPHQHPITKNRVFLNRTLVALRLQ
jgi:hypothetical protein